MQGRVERLFTYPIKGLSARPLEGVDLAVGQGFPGDRLFGFAKASSGFDPDHPEPLPKTSFIVLAEHAKLAGLETSFDASTGEFVAEANDGGTLRFDLSSADGKRQAADFLTRLLDLSDADRPNFVEGSPHRFTDVSVVSETMMNAVSLINLDSVEAFGARIGETVDPMRFRANIYFGGWPPFSELDMVDREISLGRARLKVLLRTQRCAATEVNPGTAERDLRVPYLLRKTYGHLDMGIYAEVIAGGSIGPGDLITVDPARQSDGLDRVF